MTICVIELNDSELRVGAGSNILVRSPGYAVVHNDSIRLGEDALRQARIYPHRAHNRFWSHLNQDTLPVRSKRFRHNADLAYAHLLALHEQANKPEEIIFAVPGNFSNQQLSLLLGIAKACPFSAVGLVDSAVAAVAAVAAAGHYLYVDIGLYHTVLTQVDVGDAVVRRSVKSIDDVGLNAIYDAAAELMADTFIRQSRFDPRRYAETEQALYDQLSRCLHSAGHEVPLQIEFQGMRHQARLDQDRLLEKMQPFYTQLWQRLETDETLLLSDRIAALPGFTEKLSRHDRLDPEDLFRGCHEHRPAIQSTESRLSFVTRLPAAAKPKIIGVSAAKKKTAEPGGNEPVVTHLLIDHRAFPLQPRPLYLTAQGTVSRSRQDSSRCALALNGRQAEIRPSSDAALYVNGEPLVGTRRLVAGDKISFAGSETLFSLIGVADPDAA